eukprot:CAMPEP_0205860078 /NCGR_PEP_ID=MMETSP1083-20121108/5053_1 /ASSEMBLY_ACC=CAM_ASM_000430 /TAXON_ID=97485 /ORGANISM="Prymnesium parvum, Strain Texoma1" /LENGTH=32 /DNA_ID= /DNA_START= /DNA_END= /DNA_ORIENTATION=
MAAHCSCSGAEGWEAAGGMADGAAGVRQVPSE